MNSVCFRADTNCELYKAKIRLNHLKIY